MRPRRCVQARICPSAKASRYRVRPVSRRPVCGSRRIAPRFANVDRSLVRPFPHRRYAYRVRGRLRPVSRRPVRGSRRIAPRFANVDRSLVRPFPHRRYAYRVRGASPQAGRTVRRKRGPMNGDLTREVRLDSTSWQCAYIRLRERIPASGAPAPRCAETLLRRTRAHLTQVCPQSLAATPLLFARPLIWSFSICAVDDAARQCCQ
jgi:hypothetical protein